MQVGDVLTCSRHGGSVLLTRRMKEQQCRICDECIRVYKAKIQANETKASAAYRVASGAVDRRSLPGEVWKAVPGYPGYEASSAGRIRSVDREDSLGRFALGMVLRPHADRRGYISVRARKEGASKATTTPVHKLVALAFLGARPDGMEVAHNDGRPGNCRPSNLRYATHADNEADKNLHGTKFIPSGERNWNAKLTSSQVQAIRARLQTGLSQRSIADEFGVSQSLISHIKRGKHWRESHV